MLARKRGRLVAVSSIAGLVATPMRSTYASKTRHSRILSKSP